METHPYLHSCISEAKRYKRIGDAVLERVSQEQLHFQPQADTNSIAMLVHHLSGNMLSRFTDFFSSDGEKSWRQRDLEFEPVNWSPAEAMAAWKAGWDVYLGVLETLTEADLDKTVYIRSEPHRVWDAIQRQQAHYPYHIGQMTLLAKWQLGDRWESLSIAKNQSAAYLQQMKEKHKKA